MGWAAASATPSAAQSDLPSPLGRKRVWFLLDLSRLGFVQVALGLDRLLDVPGSTIGANRALCSGRVNWDTKGRCVAFAVPGLAEVWRGMYNMRLPSKFFSRRISGCSTEWNLSGMLEYHWGLVDGGMR